MEDFINSVDKLVSQANNICEVSGTDIKVTDIKQFIAPQLYIEVLLNTMPQRRKQLLLMKYSQKDSDQKKMRQIWNLVFTGVDDKNMAHLSLAKLLQGNIEQIALFWDIIGLHVQRHQL